MPIYDVYDIGGSLTRRDVQMMWLLCINLSGFVVCKWLVDLGRAAGKIIKITLLM